MKNIWIVLLAVLLAGCSRREAAETPTEPAEPAVAKPTAAPTTASETPKPPAESNLPEPASAPTSTGQASPAPTNDFASGLAKMMQDPQMKEMVRVQQRQSLDRMYGTLYRQLGLPADELEALKELLLERQLKLVEMGMAAMSASESERRQAAVKTNALKAEYDKKIEDLLGPQDYAVFNQYEQTTPERMQIQMFKDTLPADAALTERQEADLIAAMYEARRALPATSLLNTGRASDPSQLTEERIAETLKQLDQLRGRCIERAAAILTRPQFEKYVESQERWSAMQAAGLRMASQMFGGAPGQPAPASGQSSTP